MPVIRGDVQKSVRGVLDGLTTDGWLWPVLHTAIPAAKSRNRLPSTSQIFAPLAVRHHERIVARIRGRDDRASRASRPRAFGPGNSVLICGFFMDGSPVCRGRSASIASAANEIKIERMRHVNG